MKSFTHMIRLGGLLMLCLWVHAQASAQTAASPPRDNAPQHADAPAHMVNVEPAYKTDQGIATVDEKGTVTITAIGDEAAPATITVSRPEVNTSVEFGSDLNSYVDAYITWIKALPDFTQFVSAEERRFIEAGDYETLYKWNHVQSQRSPSTRN